MIGGVRRAGFACAAFAFVACGCGFFEARKALERDLAAAEASIQENEAAFAEAMAKASSIMPANETCALASAPSGATGSPLDIAAVLDGSAGVVVRKAATEARSPRAKRMRDEIARIRQELASGGRSISSLREEAAKLAPSSFWTWDLVVVLDAESPVGGVDEAKGTFEGRGALGRSYAFDYGKKAIVCAGTFRAESSKKIEYAAHPGQLAGYGMVGLDLDAQSLRAGREALKSVR
jgi:hypothetical protein